MSNYQEIRNRINALSADEKRRLLEELEELLRPQVTDKPKRSILELEGLGKEIWQNIDAQDYVNRERDSWNG